MTYTVFVTHFPGASAREDEAEWEQIESKDLDLAVSDASVAPDVAVRVFAYSLAVFYQSVRVFQDGELAIEVTKDADEFGYLMLRTLPDGRRIGLQQMLFTFGILVDIAPDDGWYEERYCYSTFAEAALSLGMWNGEGDPPGRWIVNKPSGRQGPGSTRRFN